MSAIRYSNSLVAHGVALTAEVDAPDCGKSDNLHQEDWGSLDCRSKFCRLDSAAGRLANRGPKLTVLSLAIPAGGPDSNARPNRTQKGVGVTARNGRVLHLDRTSA